MSVRTTHLNLLKWKFISQENISIHVSRIHRYWRDKYRPCTLRSQVQINLYGRPLNKLLLIERPSEADNFISCSIGSLNLSAARRDYLSWYKDVFAGQWNAITDECMEPLTTYRWIVVLFFTTKKHSTFIFQRGLPSFESCLSWNLS